MAFYIKSEIRGKFVGHCLGLAFFEEHIKDGTVSRVEKPIDFCTREEADRYLKSWCGGESDCKVVEE